MSWQEFNNQYLGQQIFRLQQQIEKILDPDFEIKPFLALVPELQADDLAPPALETICKAFELSDFEKDLLILCAGAEVKHRCCELLGKFVDDPQNALPTLLLAINITQFQSLEVRVGWVEERNPEINA
jgi:hypothetical protein